MINRITERISSRISSQIPEFIRADYPTFVTFLERYYEYLEQDTYAQEVIQNAAKYHDVDSTIDSLINVFLQNYGPGLPLEIVANKKVVIKYLRDFFKSKGNNLSFKYLFKILYGVDVEVNKPFDYVLKASDGNWNEPKVIKSYLVSGDPFVLKNTQIKGQVSLATASVIEVSLHTDNNLDVVELLLQPGSIYGNFLVDELVYGSKLVSRTTVADKKLAYSFIGNDEDYVKLLYTTYFKRTGEAAGVAYWTTIIGTGLKTRRQVEFDTFLVGETSGCFVRPYSTLTNIVINDGGFGYKINDIITIDSEGYKGKGLVTKIQDKTDLSDFGSIQEAKLIYFSPKANTNSTPNVTIYTPNIKIRGSYYTTSSNVLYATLSYEHGLEIGDNVLVRFTGNSSSYLQEIQRYVGEEYSIYQVKDTPFRNQFTIDVAGAASGAVVIYADTTSITSDNTLYTADISTNNPETTSGYLSILKSKQANLSVTIGVVGTYLGKWNKQDSLISDLTVVQGRTRGASETDSVKYQSFAYSVESGLDSSVWEDVTNSLLHPAGLAKFSDYRKETVKEVAKSSNVTITIS